jgi:hypothetical protein
MYVITSKLSNIRQKYGVLRSDSSNDAHIVSIERANPQGLGLHMSELLRQAKMEISWVHEDTGGQTWLSV